jgi:hypothetical protein
VKSAASTPGVADDIAAIQQLSQAKQSKRGLIAAQRAYNKAKKSGRQEEDPPGPRGADRRRAGSHARADDTAGADSTTDTSAADLATAIADLAAQIKLQNQRAEQGAGLQASEAARALRRLDQRRARLEVRPEDDDRGRRNALRF